MGCKLRTVPRSSALFVIAMRFCGLWSNRGFVNAVSFEIANALSKSVTLVWRARTFVFWYMSRVVSVELQDARNAACDKCKAVDKRENSRRFCKACGCPPTKYSELTTKNGREGHNCPLGIHPGSVLLARRPCDGPGCGKNKKQAGIDYAI